MYETDQVPGFVCLYDTDTKDKEIYRYKNNRLQDGSFRAIFSSGATCYGTRIFSKSTKTGEESRTYRLVKYANGNIEYQEQIYVIGKEWKFLTRFSFNPNNLAWEKVDL